MKNVIATTLMLTALSATAGDVVTADTNLQIGANTILANFERVTEVPAHETPNVDKSLAIGARSILGVFTAVTEVSENNVPNVEASKQAFIQGVMDRPGYHSQAPKAQYVENADQQNRG